MSTATATLRYAEGEAPAGVSTVEQVDRWLDRLSISTPPAHPSIVTLHVHGLEVGVGIGLPESFVHVESESGEPPYFVTVGDGAADGVVAFYLHGWHHTEISRRHLIPAARAREVVRHVFETGQRSPSVEWEEV
jgi:hypothetical protein